MFAIQPNPENETLLAARAATARAAPIRTQFIRAALAHVRARGGDAARLVELFALPANVERDPDVVVPLATLHAFLEAAEREARDPMLGVHIAVNFPRGIYGIVEFLARNCATLREGLQRIVQYVSLLTNRVAVTFEPVLDGSGIVRYEIPGEPLCTGRHSNEFFVCAVIGQARQLSGTAFVPKRVWFAHPAPADVSELVTFFGTSDIRFDAGGNGVELDAATVALPIRSADPSLASVLAREAASAIERQPSRVSFLDEVRGAIERELATGVPSLHAIARALGTSQRTLQRRLNEEQCSFRDLVDEVRERLSCRFLDEGALGLGEIAYKLGYAEVSAFLRAFKRWTGVTPSQYRTRNAASAATAA